MQSYKIIMNNRTSIMNYFDFKSTLTICIAFRQDFITPYITKHKSLTTNAFKTVIQFTYHTKLYPILAHSHVKLVA